MQYSQSQILLFFTLFCTLHISGSDHDNTGSESSPLVNSAKHRRLPGSIRCTTLKIHKFQQAVQNQQATYFANLTAQHPSISSLGNYQQLQQDITQLAHDNPKLCLTYLQGRCDKLPSNPTELGTQETNENSDVIKSAHRSLLSDASAAMKLNSGGFEKQLAEIIALEQERLEFAKEQDAGNTKLDNAKMALEQERFLMNRRQNRMRLAISGVSSLATLGAMLGIQWLSGFCPGK